MVMREKPMREGARRICRKIFLDKRKKMEMEKDNCGASHWWTIHLGAFECLCAFVYLFGYRHSQHPANNDGSFGIVGNIFHDSFILIDILFLYFSFIFVDFVVACYVSLFRDDLIYMVKKMCIATAIDKNEHMWI